MATLPERSRDYVGPVTDTRVWEDFDLRDDDIILSTPPKCGTTWSQAIIMMLLNGAAETERPIWKESLWLDCGFRGQDKAVEALNNQTTRRCIKSHSPLDSIPFNPKVTYITVYRHPVDVHFSLEKHVANMTADVLQFMYPEQAGAAFKRFLTAPETDAGTDDLTLASLLHHYRSFSAWAHLPNVHFFHYADLKRDLAYEIRRYAAAMGVSPSDRLIDEITAATSFPSMKQVTRNTQDTAGPSAFKDVAGFFHSATSNKWVGRLSDAEVEAYHAKFSQIAQPSEVSWLENGTPATGTSMLHD